MRPLHPILFTLVTVSLAGCSFFQDATDGTEVPESSSSSSLAESGTGSSSMDSSDAYGAKKVKSDATFYLTVDDPVSIKQDDIGTFYTYELDRPDQAIEVTGAVSPEVERITVTYTPAYGDERDADVYTLQSYKPGNPTWTYRISTANGNQRPGLNEYVIRGYDKGDSRFVERTLYVMDTAVKEQSSSSAPRNPTPLPVTWQQPEAVPAISFLDQVGELDRLQMYVRRHWMALMGQVSDPSEFTAAEYNERIDQSLKAYVVGRVTSGQYANSRVYLIWLSDCLVGDGPCFNATPPQHYALTPSGTLVRFEPKTNLLFPTTHDKTYYVDVDVPEAITDPNGAFRLSLADTHFNNTIEFFSSDSNITLKKEQYGVDLAPWNSCFVTEKKDHTTAYYSTELPTVKSVTWNKGGTTAMTAYTPFIPTGGCGIQKPCADYGFTSLQPGKHEVIGKTDSGLSVYRQILSLQEITALGKDDPQNTSTLKQVYDLLPNWGDQVRPSPQAFYDSYPVIYIPDGLGRLIHYQKENALPAVECGKPVIYLYPEKELNITVKVEPTGGITVSDPAYGNGWYVRSTPDSQILNYADGKTYPYLFWEGHGTEYTRPEKGWVVPRHEVPAFLQEKLMLLGLTERESDDFREFWEPKLLEGPYAFVTFLEQEKFDEIAPLTVEPKPDTVIRVFMDYELLDAPKAVEPLPIVTPVRKGFTVAEWGGALHRENGGVPVPASCGVTLR